MLKCIGCKFARYRTGGGILIQNLDHYGTPSSLSFFFKVLNLNLTGLAALCLMGKEKLCNTENLLLWTANRQMRLEGGFQVSGSVNIISIKF